MQFLPHREHSVSITNTSWLIMLTEVIVAHCDNRKEVISVLSTKSAMLVGGKYNRTYRGLLKMIVGVLTTCHAQYT
jgi:hypothetical protein